LARNQHGRFEQNEATLNGRNGNNQTKKSQEKHEWKACCWISKWLLQLASVCSRNKDHPALLGYITCQIPFVSDGGSTAVAISLSSDVVVFTYLKCMSSTWREEYMLSRGQQQGFSALRHVDPILLKCLRLNKTSPYPKVPATFSTIQFDHTD
jgi:hypothetical protein